MNLQLITDKNNTIQGQPRLVCLGEVVEEKLTASLSNHFKINHLSDSTDLETFINQCTIFDVPEVFLILLPKNGDALKYVQLIRNNIITTGSIIILVSNTIEGAFKKQILELKVNDIYTYPFGTDSLIERIRFLLKFRLLRPEQLAIEKRTLTAYRMPWSKRLFDIVASAFLLLMASPILLLIALCIKLESRGPVIYKSKRAGTGYRIFDFYKFRSMCVGAEKQLHQLSLTSNQYGAETQVTEMAFVKIKDDPRVTKVGEFIRKTSIDELPQLFNVLVGDMSLVGNRPLPLYEAEQLTSNEWSRRFLGPAGITGLWQISKRGKAEMSDLERRELDNHYAKNYSLLFDLKIILSTFPALLQKEKV